MKKIKKATLHWIGILLIGAVTITLVAAHDDLLSDVIARGKGLNSEQITELGAVHSTNTYRSMYYTLLGTGLKNPVVQSPIQDASSQRCVVNIDQIDIVDETTGLPLRIGDEVTIEGIATVRSGIIHPDHIVIFVQDGTGGIGLFARGIAINIRQGDLVRVTGEVGHFNGLTQLQNIAIKILSRNNTLPEAQPILFSQLISVDTAEPLEGELIRVTVKIASIPTRPIGGAYNLSIVDLTGQYTSTLRVGPGTGIDPQTLTVGGVYTITGIVGQFDQDKPHHSGYRIFPRSAADIVGHVSGRPEFEPNLVVLLTGDLHGYLEPHGPQGREIGGISRIVTLVNAIREEHPGLILLDGGDTIHGTPLAGFTEGEAVIAAMNIAGYQAMVIANHDFNFGQVVLAERAKQADFPILGANVRYTDGTTVKSLPSYVIITTGELRVGLIGLTCVRTPEKTHPAHIQGLQFLDPVVMGMKYARRLTEDEGVDAIILMLHMRWADKRAVVTAIDRAVPGVIAAAVSADAHRQHYEVLRGIPLISAGEHGEVLARLDILFREGKVKESRIKFIPITAKIARCGITDTVLAPYVKLVQKIFGEVLGETAVLLDGENVRRQETNLGNLITDVIRAYVGAEIAIQNGGGIRASIDKGPITFQEIYTTLPFENYIVILHLPGEKLLAALENGVSKYPAGRFPQVSGLNFTFDPTREPGERILKVTIGGEPLDRAKIYRVAVNCFIAAGGDGYVMFIGVERTVTARLLRDAVIAYIRGTVVVQPRVEGRIILR